jgi:hypothetical protein
MKLVVLITLIGSFAFGANPTPLFTKSAFSGYTPAEWVRTEKCEVYSNQVVLTKTFGNGPGSFDLKEVRQITLSSGVQTAIKNAIAEKVSETPNGMCDGPSMEIVLSSGEVLFSTGGCGSPKKQREGAYTNSLISIANTYCPTALDSK